MPAPTRKPLEAMDRAELESALVRAEEAIIEADTRAETAERELSSARARDRSERIVTRSEASSRIQGHLERINVDEELSRRPTVFRDGMAFALARAKKSIDEMPDTSKG
jgi:hypothetical protein